jgi:hypothetical protein
MIFRDYTGKLIEINKFDFKNDKSYYNKIIQIKNARLLYDFNINNDISNDISNDKLNKKNNNSNYSNYLINKLFNV